MSDSRDHLAQHCYLKQSDTNSQPQNFAQSTTQPAPALDMNTLVTQVLSRLASSTTQSSRNTIAHLQAQSASSQPTTRPTVPPTHSVSYRDLISSSRAAPSDYDDDSDDSDRPSRRMVYGR